MTEQRQVKRAERLENEECRECSKIDSMKVFMKISVKAIMTVVKETTKKDE